MLQPSNILYAFFSPLAAFNVSLVLHFALCAAAAYFLARTLGLRPSAAATCGAVYALCGYTLSCANLTYIHGLPWFPATFAFAHRFLREGKPRWFAAAALTGTVPLLSGVAEPTAFMWMTIAVWAAFERKGSAVASVRRLLFIAALCVTTILLAAVQIFPTLEAAAESSRSQKRPYADFAAWSLSPARLPELVIPQFFGPTNTLAEEYWGRHREDEGFPYMLSVYAGASTIVLALIGIVSPTTIPRRTRIILGSLTAAGVLLALGRALPLFQLAYESLPLIGIFRYPVKALVISMLPLALLAGAGVDALRNVPRRNLALAWTCSGLLILLALWYALSPAVRTAWETAMFATSLGPDSSAALARSLRHAAGMALAITLVASLARRAPNLTIAAAVIVVIDLMVAGWNVNPYADRSLFTEPPLARHVRNVIADGRLYSAPQSGPSSVSAPSNEIVWLAWWRMQTLFGYTAAQFGIPVAFHADFDGLAPRRIVGLTQAVNTASWPVRLNLLAASGVRALLSKDVVPSPAQRMTTIRNADGSPLHLHVLPGAASVRFATRAEAVTSDEQALARLATTPFDPARVILTRSPLRDAAQPVCASAKSPRYLERMRNRTTVEIDAQCAGYVVFAETHYPGWRAAVDGKTVPLLHADYAFTAVAVPAGRHRVTKEYRPAAPFAGAVVSAMTLVLLIAATIAGGRRLDRPERFADPAEHD